jgi:hypothetical protein
MINTNVGLIMLFGGLKSWRFYAYIFILTLCFLLFQQGDLSHTVTSSYAYLNGHFADFYEYNKKYIGGNDYLPLLYVIFAIWNIPLYLFGLTTSPELPVAALSPIEIAWSKLLLVVFFFAAVKVLAKISEIVVDDVDGVQPPVASIFATAPIAIFAVFIFSQYDIIGVFFTLLGFYFYLKKDLTRFSWLFSIAISFKYFALIIYFPLILIMEKRILHIAKYMLIGILATAVQVAIYWKSEVFRGEIFSLALSRVSGVYYAGLSFFNPTKYIIALYLLGCLYLYLKKFDVEFEWKRAVVLVPIAAYGLMFSAVAWYPQWIIIVMPFFALAYAYIRNKKLFAYANLLGMLAFIWICVNNWPHNVDVAMIQHGVLRELIPLPPLIISDFMRLRMFPIFRLIFYVFLFSPILIILIETIAGQYWRRKEIGGRLVFVIFFAGISFFLIPALVCTFIPLSLALKINPNAFVNTQKGAVISDVCVVPVGEIVGEKTVIQTFKPKLNGLSAVSVMLVIYAQSNDGEIKLRLEDAGGQKLEEKIVDAKKNLDNTYYSFSFDPILDSKGKTYRLIIQAEKSYPGTAITACASKANVYPDGELMFAGTPTGGDLVMKIHFDPHAKQF